MKDVNETNPTVTVKRKNVQSIFDYCLDNEVEFSVKAAFASKDEWDISFNLDTIKKAIAFGMFLKETRLELKGLGLPVAAAAPAAPRAKKEPKSNGSASSKEDAATEAKPAFESEGLMFDVSNS